MSVGALCVEGCLMEGAGSMQDSQLILLATHLYPSKVNGCHPSGPQRPCHKFQLKSDYSPLAQPFLVGGRCAEGLWEGLVDVVLLCSMTQQLSEDFCLCGREPGSISANINN